MISKISKYKYNVAFQMLLLCAMVSLFSWIVFFIKNYNISVILFIIISIQFFIIVNQISIADRMIIHLLKSIKYSDFTSIFFIKKIQAYNKKLASTFINAFDSYKENHIRNEKTIQYLKTLINHVPVALITVDELGNASLLNNEARKLFGISHIKNIKDLAKFKQLYTAITQKIKYICNEVIELTIDELEVKVSLMSTEIIVNGYTNHLISLQNIQKVFDTTQIEAWHDLAHVLNHELMNSFAIISSLSSTTYELSKNLKLIPTPEGLSKEFLDTQNDVYKGIEAITKRSIKLEHFVDNYRSIGKLPAPSKQPLLLKNVFNNIELLLKDLFQNRNIQFINEINPDNLILAADPEQLDQILINIIKNAIEATTNSENAKINLIAKQNNNGMILINIVDNGIGIDANTIHKVFVPFFTTKKHGSGIGLSFCKHIMLAHGGNISVKKRDNSSGTIVTLIFY